MGQWISSRVRRCKFGHTRREYLKGHPIAARAKIPAQPLRTFPAEGILVIKSQRNIRNIRVKRVAEQLDARVRHVAAIAVDGYADVAGRNLPQPRLDGRHGVGLGQVDLRGQPHKLVRRLSNNVYSVKTPPGNPRGRVARVYDEFALGGNSSEKHRHSKKHRHSTPMGYAHTILLSQYSAWLRCGVRWKTPRPRGTRAAPPHAGENKFRASRASCVSQ
ncbi:MAG: hypothetical protein BWY79_02161 [Actinobacteria bacterium ADurb.Bin444]|nr:MAG: hypothetical protein BWY79_02161 [Actinobacteria bacterium ADurb.Bin444]